MVAKTANGGAVNRPGAQELLKSLVRRLEELNERAEDLKCDVREVYREAKGEGFDLKILKVVIKRRKLGEDACREQDELLDLYEGQLSQQLPLQLNPTPERELRGDLRGDLD